MVDSMFRCSKCRNSYPHKRQPQSCIWNTWKRYFQCSGQSCSLGIDWCYFCVFQHIGIWSRDQGLLFVFCARLICPLSSQWHCKHSDWAFPNRNLWCIDDCGSSFWGTPYCRLGIRLALQGIRYERVLGVKHGSYTGIRLNNKYHNRTLDNWIERELITH